MLLLLSWTSKASVILFCDLKEGQSQIINDERDGFFEQITVLDMSIQLRLNRNVSSRAVLLDKYKKALKKDVISFTSKEIDWLKSLTNKISDRIELLNARLLPDTIRFIKVKGNMYGPLSFFTRSKSIILPEKAIGSLNEQELASVIIHEIFHIISRYNPLLRNELYRCIGFESINQELLLPEIIASKLLANPDGMSRDHIMRLPTKTANEILYVLPLIYSKYASFNKSADTYFNHLQFELFWVEQLKGGEWKVNSLQNGYSSLEEQHYELYNERLGNYTGYIIHPDEVLAEYFVGIIKGNKQVNTISDPNIFNSIKHVLRSNIKY
jgi:hypothetical protein